MRGELATVASTAVVTVPLMPAICGYTMAVEVIVLHCACRRLRTSTNTRSRCWWSRHSSVTRSRQHHPYIIAAAAFDRVSKAITKKGFFEDLTCKNQLLLAFSNTSCHIHVHRSTLRKTLILTRTLWSTHTHKSILTHDTVAEELQSNFGPWLSRNHISDRIQVPSHDKFLVNSHNHIIYMSTLTITSFTLILPDRSAGHPGKSRVITHDPPSLSWIWMPNDWCRQESVATFKFPASRHLLLII